MKERVDHVPGLRPSPGPRPLFSNWVKRVVSVRGDWFVLKSFLNVTLRLEERGR